MVYKQTIWTTYQKITGITKGNGRGVSNLPENTAMNKGKIFAFLLLLTTASCFAPSLSAQSPTSSQPAPDEAAIRQLMADQSAAWNRGSIDDFMKGYWNNDSLLFIGKPGLTY